MTDHETRAKAYATNEDGFCPTMYHSYLAGARETARADAEIARNLFALGAWDGRGTAMANGAKIADAILAAAGIERSET